MNKINREDLKKYKHTQMWIKDQTEYIKMQKENINKLNSILSDIPKRKYNRTRYRSRKISNINR